MRLVDPVALADLGRYAGRARALDTQGAMRLQASGEVLAAWVGVLEGRGILSEGTVLGLRTFALARPARCDVVVPLGAVTDRTARPDGTGDLRVPPTRALAPWSALTPPRSGWEPGGRLPADDLARVAREGLAEVGDAVRERGAAAGFVRDRVWGREVAGVRAGGAFAAFALGFLAPGSSVTVLRSARWTRLTAPGGHVLMR
ncbi:hypothetical protein H9L10_03395 [Phycicoccus endophyticus]|uniref:Uncharacterized protein n=1 Tax=Phycicoccus endophyticus TaxID=1690220 RepID=A0A7G9R5M0_9MICO|nr:hypothetical protein [Phycicoccus endophyticus]QNN50895.1 hypothetical protein H9L10_03395 [Phycicoccus endophyticus]